MKIFVTVPYRSDDGCEMIAFEWFRFDCKPSVGEVLELEAGIRAKIASVEYFEAEDEDGDPAFWLKATCEPVLDKEAARIFESGEARRWDTDGCAPER